MMMTKVFKWFLILGISLFLATLGMDNIHAQENIIETIDARSKRSFDCGRQKYYPIDICKFLVQLYNDLDWPNWKDQTNWFQTPSAERPWYGVEKLPQSINTWLYELWSIDLSNNNLSWVLKKSSEIQLYKLNLSNNNIHWIEEWGIFFAKEYFWNGRTPTGSHFYLTGNKSDLKVVSWAFNWRIDTLEIGTASKTLDIAEWALNNVVSFVLQLAVTNNATMKVSADFFSIRPSDKVGISFYPNTSRMIKAIDIRNNNLKDLSFLKKRSFKENHQNITLNLGNNKNRNNPNIFPSLNKDNTGPLNNFNTILLQNAWIERIEANAFSKLKIIEYLNLEENPLKSLGEGAFSNIRMSINFSGTQISVLPKHLFKDAYILRFNPYHQALNFSDSKINKIEEWAFLNADIKDITFKGTPLVREQVSDNAFSGTKITYFTNPCGRMSELEWRKINEEMRDCLQDGYSACGTEKYSCINGYPIYKSENNKEYKWSCQIKSDQEYIYSSISCSIPKNNSSESNQENWNQGDSNQEDSNTEKQFDCMRQYYYPESLCNFLVHTYNSLNWTNWTHQTNWFKTPSKEKPWYGVKEKIGPSGNQEGWIVDLSDNNLSWVLRKSFPLEWNIHELKFNQNSIIKIEKGAIETKASESKWLKFYLTGNKVDLILEDQAFSGFFSTFSLGTNSKTMTIQDNIFDKVKGSSYGIYLTIVGNNQLIASNKIFTSKFEGHNCHESCYWEKRWFSYISLQNNNLKDFSLIKDLVIKPSRRETTAIFLGNNKNQPNKNIFQSIKKEDIQALKQFGSIRLNDAGIEVIKPKAFENFSLSHFIDLGDNPIREIGEGVFSWAKLSRLSLSWGNISSIPKYAFHKAEIMDPFSHSIALGLHNNKINKIDDFAFKDAQIYSINFAKNPLQKNQVSSSAFEWTRIKHFVNPCGRESELQNDTVNDEMRECLTFGGHDCGKTPYTCINGFVKHKGERNWNYTWSCQIKMQEEYTYGSFSCLLPKGNTNWTTPGSDESSTGWSSSQTSSGESSTSTTDSSTTTTESSQEEQLSQSLPTLTYYPKGKRKTSSPVTATLVFPNQNFTLLNNNGSTHYTFRENGEFNFAYLDPQGKYRTIKAKVNWIQQEEQTPKWETTVKFGQSSDPIARIEQPAKKKIEQHQELQPSYKTHYAPETDYFHTQEKTQEHELYWWALKHGFTNKKDIKSANFDQNITRGQFAKLLALLAAQQGRNKIKSHEACSEYRDLNQAPWDLKNYIIEVCEYDLMWIHTNGRIMKQFYPKGYLTQAEIVTTLSRLLRWKTYDQNWSRFWEKHMDAFLESQYLSVAKPKQIQTREQAFQFMKTIIWN